MLKCFSNKKSQHLRSTDEHFGAMHRALKTLMVVFFAVILAACNFDSLEQNQLQRIENRGVLYVGTMMGPTNYYLDSFEQEAGFEFELARGLADKLGVRLEIINRYELRELWDLLDSQDIDFVAAGLDVTEPRLQRYRFTPAYHAVDQKLVYKQGTRNRPRDWSQVEGMIRVVTSSSHAELLAELEQEHPHLTWTSSHLYDADELLDHVINETIDFTIVDSHHLDIKRRTWPDLSIAFTVRDPAQLAWAFADNGDDSLYAAAIEYIGKHHESGELLTLIDRHFGHVSQFNYVDTQAFIAATESVLPEYIDLFRQYAGDFDWRLLAAISYQESHWNPWARSATGVRGLMMLTLPTAEQLNVYNRIDPEQSIRGGAEYLRQLHQRLPDRMTEPDRTWFALAAYNVGLGHLEDARVITQRQGADPDYWIHVRERLPLLRQRQFYRNTRFGFARGDEPVRYVENIRRYYDTLIWLDEQGRLPAN